MKSETKIDDTFPDSKFLIEGFSVPYRLDRTVKGRGILLYIREDIPSKRTKNVTFDESFEEFFIEINLRSKKWLLGCSYNPHRDKITPHLRNISTALDKLSTDYENVIPLGDFNVEVEEKNLSNFMSVHNLKTLIKQKACFKNPENPACIDLIANNSPRSFQNSSVFETELSDFHKFTITVLKQCFPKLKPKVVNYRDYRNFRNNEFRAELDNEMLKHDLGNMEYQHFLNIFIEILNKHAPMKQKYLRANQGRFITKDLHKAIRKCSRLRNRFLCNRTDISREEYKKQRNLCVSLLKKAKKDHFANLDIKSVTDNKKFWQTVKLLFSNKVKSKTVIKLVENDAMIDDECEIANSFNKYFLNIVKKLGILTKEQTMYSAANQLSEVEMAIIKYKNHPSIKAITDRMEKLGNPIFNFKLTSHEETEKEINNLKIKKVSQKSDVPVKIIKENVDIISYFLYHNFNNLLSCATFPTSMKYADVTPIHKKDDKTDKENYRPTSIFPKHSKVYERLMYHHIYPYFDTLFSKFQCGFRKGFNAQHCVLALIEKWRKTLDTGGETGAVLTDLSKAFDCIDHNLLIAKLDAYGFEKQSIGFLHL